LPISSSRYVSVTTRTLPLAASASLVEVFAAVLLAADDLDPPRQEVERRHRERLALGAHDDESAVGPQPTDRVGHGVRRVARAEHDVRAACAGQARAVADYLVGAEVADEPILVRRARYRDGVEAGRLRVLDSQVPQPADAHDGDALARLWRRPAESRPDGVAGAEDRRRLLEGEPLRQQHRRVGVGEQVLGVAARKLHARAEHPGAEHRLAARAPLAPAARGLHPGDADAVADLARRHSRADGDDLPDRLVAERPREGAGISPRVWCTSV
jgi:hypothetical protein